jgi:hypothetical protein
MPAKIPRQQRRQASFYSDDRDMDQMLRRFLRRITEEAPQRNLFADSEE